MCLFLCFYAIKANLALGPDNVESLSLFPPPLAHMYLWSAGGLYLGIYFLSIYYPNADF